MPASVEGVSREEPARGAEAESRRDRARAELALRRVLARRRRVSPAMR